jgi:flavodoxin
MKALVIYDTNFGNTKMVADHLANQLGEGARSISVNDFRDDDLTGIELLVVGSPIVGWKPTEKMGQFLEGLGRDRLKGIKTVAFDTRVKMFISGDAGKKISQALTKAGAEIILGPQAFYVGGKEGPILDGELEKTAEMAKLIKSKL